ncbi:hypothetical protein HELRODRAFT_158839 [Helobdella robusta]|uniref:Ig-like domain-containing protein n=1 Tax=Helobdella robusta TaxID=6412 RepID=T1ENB8_HELRO|nr:hypothetical protein HELRODRAFT_158839 [Helobdella robusta]ESO12337.1 hypothetical protein HELRODRAFT_158839 [Helobdella robusta]
MIVFISTERPKVIDPLDKPFNQNVTVGADAIFRCNPTADPKPEIEWLVNGKKWQAATEIIKEPKDVIYDPNSNATFECEAITDRDTTVTYTWLLNNQKIEDGSVKTDQSVLFLDLANLPKNGRKYIGEWTCNASNSYSFDVKRASLIDKSAGYIWPYWWIILLILILFLLALFLICLICCCLYRNRGDQYLVDEIEHKNGNDPEKELIASGFHDYQRDRSGSTGTLSSQERTLTKQKRSQGSLGGSQSRLADFAN